MTRRAVLSIALFLVLLGVTGCCLAWPVGGGTSRTILGRVSAGPTQRETYRVEAEDAERVEATVRFAGGTLEVRADGEDLLEGEFVYNLEALRPQVEYEVRNRVGELLVTQEQGEVQWDGSTQVRNEWLLQLGDRVPLELRLLVGATKGSIDLGGLPLTRLLIDAGAAEMDVRFSAPNPEQIASLNVRSGAARLQLLSLGNANADEIHFDGGLGTYTFDFGGRWQRSCRAHIVAGASRIDLRVPLDIGVRVCPGDLHDGDYGGLVRDGACYSNELYEHAETRLEIDLDLGLGRVEVEQLRAE